MGQVDVSQRNAWLKSDSPPQGLPCEESNSIHWNDRMAAPDGKTKQYDVETNLEGLLGRSPGTISRPGL